MWRIRRLVFRLMPYDVVCARYVGDGREDCKVCSYEFVVHADDTPLRGRPPLT